MNSNLLKKYDKYLDYKKNLDGTVTIYRQSPYSSMRYEVLVVSNQYLGSLRWVLRKIVLMDSTRQDFFVSAISKNEKIRQGKVDKRLVNETVDFIKNGGYTFVN